MKFYSSTFSDLLYRSENQLILEYWKAESQSLDEAGVKFEISKILDCINEHTVRNIIIDARNYSFRDNIKIQQWINYTYMPLIMKSGVRKYAIIVKEQIESIYENFEVEKVLPEIEYFTDPEEAQKWIRK